MSCRACTSCCEGCAQLCGDSFDASWNFHGDPAPKPLSDPSSAPKGPAGSAKVKGKIVSRWWYVRSDTHVVSSSGDHIDLIQYTNDWDDSDAWKNARGVLLNSKDVADEKRTLRAARYSRGRVRAVCVTRRRKAG